MAREEHARRAHYKPLHRNIRHALAIKKGDKRGAWNVVARQSLSWAVFRAVALLFLQMYGIKWASSSAWIRLHDTAPALPVLHKRIAQNPSKITDYAFCMNIPVHMYHLTRVDSRQRQIFFIVPERFTGSIYIALRGKSGDVEVIFVFRNVFSETV